MWANLYFAIFGLSFVNLLISVLAMRSFLARSASISSPRDLEALKKLVRLQMYQALAYIPLAVVWIILGCYLIATGKLNFLLFLGLNGVIFAAGSIGKKFERRIRQLPAGDANLEAEHKKICEIWGKKALPGF